MPGDKQKQVTPVPLLRWKRTQREKGALPPPLPGERERRASQLTHHFGHFKNE